MCGFLTSAVQHAEQFSSQGAPQATACQSFVEAEGVHFVFVSIVGLVVVVRLHLMYLSLPYSALRRAYHSSHRLDPTAALQCSYNTLPFLVPVWQIAFDVLLAT